MPQHFEEKYKKLPTAPEIEGHMPDLVGMKDGLRYLCDVKIFFIWKDLLSFRLSTISAPRL